MLLAGGVKFLLCAPNRRREAPAGLAPKGRAAPSPPPGADRGGEPTEGRDAMGIRLSPDLRVLPRDTGALLYRWFLLYRQDIQRV